MPRPTVAADVHPPLASDPLSLTNTTIPTSSPDNESEPTATTTIPDPTLINVVDLEATCFKPRATTQTQDIIEVGITTINTTTLSIHTTHSLLVLPTHSVITSFCTQLTTLTAEQVQAEGVSFQMAMDVLESRFGLSQRLFASYGAFDIKLLCKQVVREGLDVNKLPLLYLNIKKLVAVSYKRRRECGMMTALAVCGIRHVGVHHRGDDDSRNIAAIMLHLMARHANDQLIQQSIVKVSTVV